MCTNIRIYIHIYIHPFHALTRSLSDCVYSYVYTCTFKYSYVDTYTYIHMGWLRLVGSIKLQVSFAEYHFFYRALLQKRPIMLSILLVAATPPYTYFMHSPKLLLDCLACICRRASCTSIPPSVNTFV